MGGDIRESSAALLTPFDGDTTFLSFAVGMIQAVIKNWESLLHGLKGGLRFN